MIEFWVSVLTEPKDPYITPTLREWYPADDADGERTESSKGRFVNVRLTCAGNPALDEDDRMPLRKLLDLADTVWPHVRDYVRLCGDVLLDVAGVQGWRKGVLGGVVDDHTLIVVLSVTGSVTKVALTWANLGGPFSLTDRPELELPYTMEGAAIRAAILAYPQLVVAAQRDLGTLGELEDQ